MTVGRAGSNAAVLVLLLLNLTLTCMLWSNGFNSNPQQDTPFTGR